MLKYFGTCLSALVVARRHPELLESGGFRLGRDAVQGWAIAGILAVVAIIVIGFSTDWRPYAVLGVWAAVGVGYWLVSRSIRPVRDDDR